MEGSRSVTALYRKYRPQDFDEVVGQEPVVRTLKNAIAAGQVRQAYIFAGPRGTGKTSLARILAKGLNCVNGPTPNPDKTCHACVAVARGARGSFRDAVSTLDQLSTATGGHITVQDVLQLLGAVEEEALFRLCDLVVDGDTAGALTFVEQLAAQGQDIGRLVLDLLEHLRALMLVQHMGEVPDSLPLTEETRDRLAAQANQLGAAVVVRLIDLLAVAVDDMRQGG